MIQKQTQSVYKCPKQGCVNTLRLPLIMNALSRIDNQTFICSECGTNEAMEDFAGVEKTPFDPSVAQ